MAHSGGEKVAQINREFTPRVARSSDRPRGSANRRSAPGRSRCASAATAFASDAFSRRARTPCRAARRDRAGPTAEYQRARRRTRAQRAGADGVGAPAQASFRNRPRTLLAVWRGTRRSSPPLKSLRSLSRSSRIWACLHARRRAHRRGRWRCSRRPDTQGKNGSVTGPTIPLGPRLREAVKLRRSAPSRDDGGFNSSSRAGNFQQTPRN